MKVKKMILPLLRILKLLSKVILKPLRYQKYQFFKFEKLPSDCDEEENLLKKSRISSPEVMDGLLEIKSTLKTL